MDGDAEERRLMEEVVLECWGELETWIRIESGREEVDGSKWTE
jgi:hypothetical protein